jgi:hypothetical protein
MFDKFNKSHPILKEKNLLIEDYMLKESNFSGKTKIPPSVIIYNTSDYTYTEFFSYKPKEILTIINNFPRDKTLFIQVNNDDYLHEHITKSLSKKFLERESKKSRDINKLDLDYSLVIDNNTLCLNIGILSHLVFHDIEKYAIQLYIFEKGVLLFNKTGNKEIFDMIISEYKFKEENNKNFTDRVMRSVTQKKLTHLDFKLKGFCTLILRSYQST